MKGWTSKPEYSFTLYKIRVQCLCYVNQQKNRYFQNLFEVFIFMKKITG